MEKTDKQTMNRILLVLFIGVLMAALDIAIVGPALPAIQGYFGLHERALSWIFTIFVLFNLVATPLMSKLSDLFGRRLVYVGDVTLFALGSLIVALSPNFTILLLGRAIQGFGAGGIFPVASAVIGDTFPAEKRGRALGLIGAVFGVAFLLGPILGGLLLMLGWQWLFIINLPIAALVIALSLRLLPGRIKQRGAAFDWSGMIVLGVALASLTLGINHIDTVHFFNSLVSANVWPFITIALVLLILLVFLEQRVQREQRRVEPILRPDLFKSRQLILTYVLAIGAGLGESGLVFMPALAVAALGVSTGQASFLLLPVVLAMGLGSPLAGRLLDKYGSKLVIISGTSILTLGLVLLSLFASTMAFYILAGVFIGLGLSALLGAPLRYIMLNETTADDRSSAQGLVTLFTSIGQLMGATIVGAVAASRGGGISGYSTAYLVTAMVALLLVITAFSLKTRAAELEAATRE